MCHRGARILEAAPDRDSSPLVFWLLLAMMARRGAGESGAVFQQKEVVGIRWRHLGDVHPAVLIASLATIISTPLTLPPQHHMLGW